MKMMKMDEVEQDETVQGHIGAWGKLVDWGHETGRESLGTDDNENA